MRVLGFFIVIFAVVYFDEAIKTLGRPQHPSPYIALLPGLIALVFGLLLLRGRKRSAPSRTEAVPAPAAPAQAVPMPARGSMLLSTYQYLPPESHTTAATKTDWNLEAKRRSDAAKVKPAILLSLVLMGVRFLAYPSLGAGIELLILGVLGGIIVIGMELKK
jgi:hypothetical protein